jgi:hypothetical protein
VTCIHSSSHYVLSNASESEALAAAAARPDSFAC